jgi:hypothetical protein
MDRQGVKAWLEAYVQAWRDNDRSSIAALFTLDAEYRYHPSDDPIRGGEAIAASWLEDPDQPGTWDAWYEPFAVEGDAAVAFGVSTYFAPDGVVARIYDNVFLMRFEEDGRCRAFTEWYVKRQDAARAEPGAGPAQEAPQD